MKLLGQVDKDRRSLRRRDGLRGQIHKLTNRKAAWLESDFCPSCASYIATPVNGYFCLQNLAIKNTPQEYK